MINKHSDNIKNGHRISIILILCLFGFCLVQAMQAPKKRSKKRPDGDRVYLLHADELRYDMFGSNPDAQIVKGKVSFAHQGATSPVIVPISIRLPIPSRPSGMSITVRVIPCRSLVKGLIMTDRCR